MKKFIKHFGVLVIGILCMSAGVALSKLSLLGTSPIVNWPIGIAVILLMTFGILEIGDVPNKDNLESATP
ncbi:hypothetical protein WP50_32550, partial [Lactiplantibacillus plantarum]